MITIELHYQYSELDKKHNFGIVTQPDMPGAYKSYVQWIWFHVGRQLARTNKETYVIYPYKVGKLKKAYKYCNDAERQGTMIANRIKMILKNSKV